MWTLRSSYQVLNLSLVVHEPLCDGVDRVEAEKLKNTGRSRPHKAGSSRFLPVARGWGRDHFRRLVGRNGMDQKEGKKLLGKSRSLSWLHLRMAQS